MNIRTALLALARAMTRVDDGIAGVADRWLHRRRHEHVKRLLGEMPRPRAIMVVCEGNVFRSPYLEAVLRRSLTDVRVSSAGLRVAGAPVPADGLAIAARNGFDLTRHASRLLTRRLLENVDLVVVMDARQRRYVAGAMRFDAHRIVVAGDLDAEPAETRAIPDPWRQRPDVLERSYARLDRCAAALVGMLRPRA